MKIAIPSESGDGLAAMRSGHFGHAAYMTVVEYDEMGCGGVIQHVLDLGVDGILAAGMGRPPLMRFTESGVIVYAETTTPNVGDAARLFAEGRVQRMSPEAACSHH